MSKRMAGVAGLAVLAAAGMIGGCKKPGTIDYNRELPPGASALRKITDPELLPDFRAGFTSQPQDLVAAIDGSLAYLGHRSSEKYYPMAGITHAQVVESLKAFRALVLSARSGEELQKEIVSRFEVYESVGCDGLGTVLFTGYYTPIFEGSRTKDGTYKHALYKLPPDLVKDAEGNCLGRKLADGSLAPYPTRGEIETSGMLEGQGLELVYLKEKFEAYICQIQGSAKIRLADGQMMEVGYAGKNKAPYKSISQMLVDEGKIPPARRSLSSMREYFRQHPEEVDRYLQQNPSYVFFQESSGGPYGSLGVAVTPGRSLATDKSIFPRACLVYAVTAIPGSASAPTETRAFEQFMLDQDTGGAIRAAGRADIYLGTGEEAGRIAGWTASEGRLYYLVLKPEMMTGAKTASR